MQTPRPIESGIVEPIQDVAKPYENALQFLYDRLNYERLVGGTSRYPFRLQRITTLLRELGLSSYLHVDAPCPKVPLVHIAGTKGKGSTAAMVSAILSAAGLRTGLYTSPHLHSLEERFRVDGQPCSKSDVVSLVDRIRPATEQIQSSVGSPSFFELTTAMALSYFDASDCDAVVMEVGLGGRLDSTNVCAPTVSAVTSIGLDHQHVLGDNLRDIATEKAGILKPGVPVVSGVVDSEAAEVIANRAASTGSELYKIDRDFSIEFEPLQDWGSHLAYQGLKSPLTLRVNASLSMEGQHQARNASLAIAIVELLQDKRIENLPQSIQDGLGELNCPGRIERYRLADNVTALVDAAHNEDSVAALCHCLRHRKPQGPIAIVFGTSVDKSADVMLRMLGDVADHIVLTRFQGNPRFKPVAELQPLLPEPFAHRTELVDDPIQACQRGLEAASPNGMLVVCGSFFLAAETRHWVQEQAKQNVKRG